MTHSESDLSMIKLGGNNMTNSRVITLENMRDMNIDQIGETIYGK